MQNEKHKYTYRRNITVEFILLACARDGKEEGDIPGNTHFSPHLEVDVANTWVKDSTHEHIIHEVPRHADLLSAGDSPKVHPEADGEAVDDGHRHQVPEVVDDRCEREGTGKVQSGSGEHRDIEAGKSVAVVHERLVAERRHRESFLLVARNDERDKELEEKESRVDFPCISVRARILDIEDMSDLRYGRERRVTHNANVLPHLVQERLDVIQ